MKSELPEFWIEVGNFDPPRLKGHAKQYSSVWFQSIEEVWDWAWKIHLEQKPVDTPAKKGVKQP